MPISIFKIFIVFGIVSTWASRALQNGKISLVEAAELATLLGDALGIPTELGIPEPAAEVLLEVDLEEDAEVETTNPVADKLKAFATPTPKGEGGEES